MLHRRKLRVGNWVEIRGKDEILKTLDKNGELDGMPFMPEMLAFCGKRFQVYKRAHKTCDTVFPIRSRRVDRSVHLVTRCDGQAHGGCDATCLIFWKDAWLRRLDPDSPSGNPTPIEATPIANGAGCTEADIWAHVHTADSTGDSPTYTCQATRLPYATTDLAWWDIRQYVEDFLSGNVGLWRLCRGLIYSIYYNLSQAGLGVGPAMRWFYDRFHPIWGGPRFPRKPGLIPAGRPTPAETFNLRPGELVRVRSHEEILRTVTTANKNRGMYWDAEMVPYCGRTYRVLKRVTKILDEGSGKLIEMKTACVILDGVVCQARYSGCRMFCPRSIHPYWREIWLARIEPAREDPEKWSNE